MTPSPQGEGAATELGADERRRRTQHLIRRVDILLVDDNPALRRTVAAALQDEGYEVLSASDGVDALRVIEQTDPWLLLLDIQMPRMDGRELIQQMKARGIRTSVVVMSGAANARQAAVDLGADSCLEKPFEIDDLVGTAERFRPEAA